MISNQLFVKQQPIIKVAKHLKISDDSLKQCVRQYFRYSKIDIDKFSKRNTNNEIINKLISDVLQAYLDKRFGMHTTVKMMIDYLKIYFSNKVQDHSDIGFTLNMINRKRLYKVLKDDMKYSYRSHFSRPPAAFDRELIKFRPVFAKTIDRLHELGFNIIYVDECSISTDNLSTKTWVQKGSFVPLIRPTDQRLNVIAAYIMKGKYAFMLKKGTTKTHHVIMFFEKLHAMLCNAFSDDYIKYTVFVLDNARVHVSSEARTFFKEKQFAVMTLPPYTPELNKVEGTFNLIKTLIKKQNLYERRLEHVVVDAINKL